MEVGNVRHQWLDPIGRMHHFWAARNMMVSLTAARWMPLFLVLPAVVRERENRVQRPASSRKSSQERKSCRKTGDRYTNGIGKTSFCGGPSSRMGPLVAQCGADGVAPVSLFLLHSGLIRLWSISIHREKPTATDYIPLFFAYDVMTTEMTTIRQQ